MFNQCARPAVELYKVVNTGGWHGRGIDLLQVTRLNILRAVAKGLVHFKANAVIGALYNVCGQAVAPAGGQVNAQ